MIRQPSNLLVVLDDQVSLQEFDFPSLPTQKLPFSRVLMHSKLFLQPSLLLKVEQHLQHLLLFILQPQDHQNHLDRQCLFLLSPFNNYIMGNQQVSTKPISVNLVFDRAIHQAGQLLNGRLDITGDLTPLLLMPVLHLEVQLFGQ